MNVDGDLDYLPPLPRCPQCGGYRHTCEKIDAESQPYCRLRRIAYEFCGDLADCNPGGESFIKHVTELLRETEDESWDRLSTARTRELERLRAILVHVLCDVDEWKAAQHGAARALYAIESRVRAELHAPDAARP